MNEKRLTRQAIRRARRAAKKRGHRLSREEILSLPIQAFPVWIRLTIALAGLAFVALGIFAHLHETPWWIVVMISGIGIAILLIGIFGRKSYLESELKKLKDDGPTRVLDSILTGLLDGIL